MDTLLPLLSIVSIIFLVYLAYAILKDIRTKINNEYIETKNLSAINKAIAEADRVLQECYQWDIEDAIITRTTSDRLQVYYDREKHLDIGELPLPLIVFWKRRPNAKIERDEVVAYVEYEGYEITIKAPQQGRLIRNKDDVSYIYDKEVIYEIEPIYKEG